MRDVLSRLVMRRSTPNADRITSISRVKPACQAQCAWQKILSHLVGLSY